MLLRILFATLSFGAVLLAPRANAHVVDPCTVYTCMAGISGAGASGGPGCVPATSVFFSIVVFDPYYDAAATAQLRRQFLRTCLGANIGSNAAVLGAIIAEWGAVP